MKFVRIIALCVMSAMLPSLSGAGVLNNGEWLPGNCGKAPEAPAIDSASVETLNKSIAAFNEWQKQAFTYNECLVKEANADITAINKAATAEQKHYYDSSEKMGMEIDQSRKKFDRKPSSSSSGSSAGGQGY
jgi:hypothetical protein